MCLAWTTPASLVETVACQGQQRYLAKHQLRPQNAVFRQVQCILKLDCAKAAFVAGARCRAFRHRKLDVLQLRSTVTWPYHCYLPCLSGASEAAASAAPAAAPAAAPVVGPTEIQESEETEELRHRALFFRHQLGKLWIWKPGRWSFLADRKSVRIGMIGVGNVFFWKTWPTWKLCFVRWCNRQGCWTIYSSDCTSNFCATKMLPCIWQIISEAHQHLERGYMLRHFYRNQDDLGWLATAYVGGKWYSHTLSWLHLRLSRTSTTGRNPCRNWPSKSRLVCAKPLRSRWTSLPPGRKGVGVGVGTHVERPYSH